MMMLDEWMLDTDLTDLPPECFDGEVNQTLCDALPAGWGQSPLYAPGFLFCFHFSKIG
jgi:hypothetical protein